jgi:hypothetical protein
MICFIFGLLLHAILYAITNSAQDSLPDHVKVSIIQDIILVWETAIFFVGHMKLCHFHFAGVEADAIH